MSRSKIKHKPKKFTAANEARRRARELAGPPPAARVIPDKRLKPPKHKKKLIGRLSGTGFSLSAFEFLNMP